MPSQPHNLTATVTLIAVIAFVLALRVLRMRRGRRLRLEMLWVWPSFVVAAAAAMFAFAPPPWYGWLTSGAALLIGALLGGQRAMLVKVEIDPVTHELRQRETPWAILFIVALVLLRQLARGYAGAEAAALHVNVLVVSDVLVALAAGLFVAQRVVLYRRGRALLAAARAGEV